MPASGKILNTNMGLGFQRGRKYDTDLDRLGRMETAQGELRKTGQLNMQKELRKLKKGMATYSVKRFSVIQQREYGLGDMATGVVDGARDLTGNVVEGAGKVLDNGVAKTIAGGAGAIKGAGIGAAVLGSAFPVLGLGHIAGAIGGGLLGGMIGSKAAEVGGKALKSVGQDIHT